MRRTSEAFEDALMAFLLVVADLPLANETQRIGEAVATAPADHPVHAMSLRSYRCHGCRRFGVLADVALDFASGEGRCPACDSERLELVEEGRA